MSSRLPADGKLKQAEDGGADSTALGDETHSFRRPSLSDEGIHVRSDTEDGVQQYSLSESRKIGITGSVFLILNKMIGTGSTLFSFSFSRFSCRDLSFSSVW